MYSQPYQPVAPAATIRSLGTHETKDSIDTWFNQCKSFLRTVPCFARYMDLTWKSYGEDINCGFEEKTVAGTKLSPKDQSTQVEALIDLICTYSPELDVSHIREEATCLAWIYNYVREHYGCKRTGRQMMQKFTTLKRKEGERLNAYSSVTGKEEALSWQMSEIFI